MQRRLLIALPVAVVGAWGAARAKAQSVELRESDPEALAVDYRADAQRVDRAQSPQYRPGQTCANCNLFYPDAGSPLGGCQYFLGKDVAAAGWCKVWAAKA
jgi:hypothetical protein